MCVCSVSMVAVLGTEIMQNCIISASVIRWPWISRGPQNRSRYVFVLYERKQLYLVLIQSIFSVTNPHPKSPNSQSRPRQRKIDTMLLHPWCAMRARWRMWTKHMETFLWWLTELWMQWHSREKRRSRRGSKNLFLVSILCAWFNKKMRIRTAKVATIS